MQAGNAIYQKREDLPRILPILALPHLMLLPGGFVSATVEENAHTDMVNDALKGDRLLGVTQPLPHALCLGQGKGMKSAHKSFYDIGCIGRITNYSEIGDGSLLISLQGVCRFHLLEPVKTQHIYPMFMVDIFDNDLRTPTCDKEIDRNTFLSVFRDYLDMHNMQADWDNILDAPDDVLVNALSIIAPFGTTEKQALLEASDLKLRAEMLIAIAEQHISKRGGGHDFSLQ